MRPRVVGMGKRVAGTIHIVYKRGGAHSTFIEPDATRAGGQRGESGSKRRARVRGVVLGSPGSGNLIPNLVEYGPRRSSLDHISNTLLHGQDRPIDAGLPISERPQNLHLHRLEHVAQLSNCDRDRQERH